MIKKLFYYVDIRKIKKSSYGKRCAVCEGQLENGKHYIFIGGGWLHPDCVPILAEKVKDEWEKAKPRIIAEEL